MKKIASVFIAITLLAITTAIPAGAAIKTVNATSPGGNWCCFQ